MKVSCCATLALVLIACDKEPLPGLQALTHGPNGPLSINEAAPRGTEGHKDLTGDWIELQAGESGIVMDGDEWYVSDDPHDPLRFTLPPMELAPRAYLLLRCDEGGKEDGALHTGFRLSSGGERVTLARKVGDRVVLVDAVELFPIDHGHSTQGRVDGGTGAWVHLEAATPGEPNSEAVHADEEEKE